MSRAKQGESRYFAETMAAATLGMSSAVAVSG
jgi:hypothetical protein